MSQQSTNGNSEDLLSIHQYYIDILNCMPNIVYWVDMDCNLKGCNSKFIKLLGIRSIKDFSGTPYDYLQKYAHWPLSRIESLKLDDMAAIFSGEAKYEVTEKPFYDKENNPINYLSTRVPLLDKKKHVVGLVVILTNVTEQKKISTAEPSPEYPSQQVALKKPPYILMVEDNVVAQKVEQSLLTSLNCQVDIAESGEQAIQLFSPGKYDIIFMDIGLQDTSGYIVAKKMRKLEENTQYRVPIIALTSYDANIVKYDCSEYSMDGVLTKPMTSEQAQQIIQHYIYQDNTPVEGLQWVEAL
jgi:CheY-like chemotaxis protein